DGCRRQHCDRPAHAGKRKQHLAGSDRELNGAERREQGDGGQAGGRHCSMVASSTSITGMSSLIGYTRWQVAHLRAVPSLTSVTGVLQLGQARISSSCGSIAMAGVTIAGEG